MNLTLSICLLRLHRRSSIQLDREGIVFFEAPTNALCVIFECNQRTISNLNPLRRVNWYELTERSVGRSVVEFISWNDHDRCCCSMSFMCKCNCMKWFHCLYFSWIRLNTLIYLNLSTYEMFGPTEPKSHYRLTHHMRLSNSLSKSLYAHIFNAFTVCTFQNPYRFECMHAFIIS